LSDDDPDLFRRALADVKPLRPESRVPDQVKKPKPGARFARADHKEVLRESMLADIDTLEQANSDKLRFHRAPVGRRTMRKLERGNFSIQSEIDLHGMTVAEAKPRLAAFIAACARNGNYCVRIVHGKGLGSGVRGPILKLSVNRWLRQWDAVLAFVSARQVDGGTGALYVLLRNGRA